MLTAAKEETFSTSSDPCVFFPLAASGVYPKNRVWGSKPENVHCSSAIGPLKIELRWGYEKSRGKTAVGSGVTFKYDPFGRRIYKSSSTATSIYAYDGDNLIEETNSSGTAVARYAQGLNIDEPLAMLRSATTSYYQADGLGSITSLTSGAGALAQTYTFDSFGNQTASSGSLTNPFQYTARESDAETGLYYYRARYYDPNVGRFTREDPRKEVLAGLNFYEYVRNSSPNLSDPDGRDPCGWLCRLWNWLKFGKEVHEPVSSAIDWSFCGLYYERCLTTNLGIQADLAQALSNPDPVVYATALATLAQQTGSNSMSSLKTLGLCKNDENCKKAAKCAKKGVTSPLPPPFPLDD
jgi:RHS repeat-associated protein